MLQDRRPRQVATIVVLAALLPAAGTLHAQDANYWDNQYGTKGELLGGLVVGSPGDLSATFYNPGWIPLGVDASLLVTTQAVQVSSLTVKNVLGQGSETTYSNAGTSPGFLAGRFNAVRAEGWQFAWSYMEKVRFEFDAGATRIDTQPIPPLVGEQWFSGETFRNTRTTEYWYGFTAATKLSEHSAIGFTPYFVYRSQRQRIQGALRYMEGTAIDRSLFIADEFNFGHSRLLAKVGMAFDYSPVTFGVTLTTPGLGLAGSGSVLTTTSATGFDTDPYVEASDQDDLVSSWKSPISLAVGVAWRGRDTGLHFTAEWFAANDQEAVLDPAPFRSQTTGELVGWDMSVDQRSVLNFGLGIDHRFNEKFALYGAFRTDFSSLEPDQSSDVLMSTWDLWHFTTGASFQFLGVGFTSGLQYSFGNDNITRYLDFTNNEGDTDRDVYVHSADMRYRRLKLVVGFDLALLGTE